MLEVLSFALSIKNLDPNAFLNNQKSNVGGLKLRAFDKELRRKRISTIKSLMLEVLSFALSIKNLDPNAFLNNQKSNVGGLKLRAFDKELRRKRISTIKSLMLEVLSFALSIKNLDPNAFLNNQKSNVGGLKLRAFDKELRPKCISQQSKTQMHFSTIKSLMLEVLSFALSIKNLDPNAFLNNQKSNVGGLKLRAFDKELRPKCISQQSKV
ncbi:hypothetical protein FQR65_LT19497 [Abscondita terminalis]|nr:hypothetical protein FQR65_LT19497 [Abscondita terminalis]